MWDFWWTKWHCGRIYSEYFGIPCPFSFHQLLHSHQSTEAGTKGPLVARVPRGLSHPISRKRKVRIVDDKAETRMVEPMSEIVHVQAEISTENLSHIGGRDTVLRRTKRILYCIFTTTFNNKTGGVITRLALIAPPPTLRLKRCLLSKIVWRTWEESWT
jgi:hypothetical protein